MNRKLVCQANRAAWNEVMPLHRRAAGERLDRVFSIAGSSVLSALEEDLHRRFGLEGKAIAHLCCNNGQELMSLKNLGAGACVGFDFSDEAIAEARARASRCARAVDFVCTDVYEIDGEWNGRFDKVYISAGCLGWMPDLPGFFAVCRRLLRPGGHVFIHEIHPLAEALPCDGSKESRYMAECKDAPGRVVVLADSYFRKEPCVEHGGLDYVGGTDYDSHTTQYWFVHTMASILMGLSKAGYALEFVEEFPVDVSGGRGALEKADIGLPLSYVLVERAV